STAFAFAGRTGRVTVVKEARSRGGGYWYAYSTQKRRTSKRYLGRTDNVTFSRLEQVAKELTHQFAPAASEHPAHQTTEPLSFAPNHNGAGSGGQARSQSGGVGPDTEHRVVLLSAKLSPPRPSIWLVGREHLLGELDAALSHPLTLLSAPAGSGKTTLLSAWVAVSQKAPESLGRAARPEHEIAWLSLDELDNDTTRFWTAVIAALRRCMPHLGRLAQEMLHSPQAPILSTTLMALLSEIEQTEREIILILDDYHVISDQAIHDSLHFLLDHLPYNLHLILSSRADPALPLSRFRVRAQMGEIRATDLRFSLEETASFLHDTMSLPLSQSDVEILQERTEGWVAGLQLAALSMRKQQNLSAWVSHFGGSHRYLLDYVQQEILASLPTHLLDFLLATSILTRMNASLCQAVTEANDQQTSQQALEELERSNLFVVPLNEQRQWYRYHDLFREALLTHVRTTQSQLIPLLHRRAARWYEAAGDLHEAITHALAAPDYPLAASLIELAAPSFWLSGEARTINNWMLSLPDVVLRSHVRLALNAALRLLNSAHTTAETLYAEIVVQVEQIITRMEEIVDRKLELTLSEAEVAFIERRVHLLHALMESRMLLKLSDIEGLKQRFLELDALPPDEETAWKLIPLSFVYWVNRTLLLEGAQLVPRFEQMKQQMNDATDLVATTRFLGMLAALYLMAGQFRQAHQQCLESLALIERTGGRTAWTGYIYYWLFEIYYAWNRLDEAADSVQHLLQIAYDWQQVDLQIIGQSSLARLSIAREDRATAQQALQKAIALEKQGVFAVHYLWMISAQVPFWLAEGNMVEANQWAAQVDLAPDTWEPWRKGELQMWGQVALAQQQYQSVIEILERFRERVEPQGDKYTAEFLSLYVVALHHTGKRAQARTAAARLLSLTEPGNILRMYLDLGLPMKRVLQALLAPPPEDEPGAGTAASEEIAMFRPFLSRLLAAFEQEQRQHAHLARLSPAIRQMSRTNPTQVEMQAELLEPLSQQELRVLRLLVAGQTYGEMAKTLIVSPNTIKTQVGSIYRKLGVSRRAEAIMASKHFHLL
ncbi:MAG: LuxR family transcriptional regulator, partial [Ktedonobacteraceae bacterium]|nr:LuxR family transcriptional regulator [Ktedonobacteraceae bacterium]